MTADTLMQVAGRSSVVLCCGSGGVGKTTVSAALALAQMRTGRRVVVVTIDPARRLADALGVSGELSNEPTLLVAENGGELWAMMLDANKTFAQLVQSYSADKAQVDRIINNRFFRNISSSLGGTQEYMAAEKLFELHKDSRFDLVVVDTPPTRKALNFFDAPGRLVRFLDHRLYRVLLAPARGSLRIVAAAVTPIVRTIARVVGASVIDDAIAFFQAFEGMDDGFRTRAQQVMTTLKAPSTSYVVVSSPRVEALDEAEFFINRLTAEHIPTAALIVNRLTPEFATAIDRQMRDAYPQLVANAEQLAQRAAAERRAIAPLVATVAPSPVAFIALLAHDIADRSALSLVADQLSAS
jgi:anion-transporting  ArsA/GET3 family ATPase